MTSRLVLDTSYLIKYHREFDTLLNSASKQERLEVIIVIPYAVLQELDKLKVVFPRGILA